MLQRKPNNKRPVFQSKQDANPDNNMESMEESIALLTKNFNEVVKKFKKFINSSNSQNHTLETTKIKNSENMVGIHCFECKGYMDISK